MLDMNQIFFDYFSFLTHGGYKMVEAALDEVIDSKVLTCVSKVSKDLKVLTIFQWRFPVKFV